jgi:hypothetical protein
MKVVVTYFKPTGKYYSTEEYTTSTVALCDIWEEVVARGLFGMIALVRVPEHPHDHPKLLGVK